MELGPLQKKWVTDLREHAERQTDGCLGYIGNNDGEMHLCCLGQALITMKESEGINPIDVFVDEWEDWERFNLFDGCSDAELSKSYEKLGLHDDVGSFALDGVHELESLADMNDQGVPWTEIADFIEENPKAVFSEPK